MARFTLAEISLSRKNVFIRVNGKVYTVTALNMGLVAVSEWNRYRVPSPRYYWTEGTLYDGEAWDVEALLWFTETYLTYDRARTQS